MSFDELAGWKGRLLRSSIYAIIGVVASTILMIALAALEGRPGAQRQDWSGIDVAAYALGFPLAPGWFLVTVILESGPLFIRARSRWFHFSALLSMPS